MSRQFMTIGERLRDLRLSKVPRPTQTEVGRLISASTDGQAQAKIKRIEAGKQTPSTSEAVILADYFHVDIVWLLTGQNKAVTIPEKNIRPIPVISWIHAGSFTEAVDLYAAGISGEGEPVHSTKAVGPHAFALRVEGDSMAPRYLPGDIIVVDPGIMCDNDSPCVVVLNGEATFKFFKETDDAVILEPMNRKFPEIVIRKDSQVDFRVVGKVVDLIPKI